MPQCCGAGCHLTKQHQPPHILSPTPFTLPQAHRCNLSCHLLKPLHSPSSSPPTSPAWYHPHIPLPFAIRSPMQRFPLASYLTSPLLLQMLSLLTPSHPLPSPACSLMQRLPLAYHLTSPSLLPCSHPPSLLTPSHPPPSPACSPLQHWLQAAHTAPVTPPALEAQWQSHPAAESVWSSSIPLVMSASATWQ